MPSIDNNTHTLLQGLSDFWTRFYKDTEELEALYRGTEVLLAQTYLDMLSSFLNISIVETPLFNTELFKLITVREDHVTFDVGLNPNNDRHRVDLPDNLVQAHILQNKVVDPTASLEVDAGYEIDDDELEFRFWNDPSGQPGTVLATISNGNLLAFGLSPNLKRFYVTEGSPFRYAKQGYWLQVQNSGAGNNATYRIARVIDDQTVLLTESTSTTLTTPDPNSGSLTAVLLDSEYTPLDTFAHRVVEVSVGGSFDDAALRATTEIESWYPASPVGLGVRKGDILRVLDREAVASVPTDFDIAVVRHGKLYLSADTPVTQDATGVVRYVVLREGPNPDVLGEIDHFTQVTTGAPKSGVAASLLSGNILQAGGAPFTSTDRQRFVTISGGGDITWTASIARDGTLTRTGGMFQPLARAFKNSKVTISGSVQGNNGSFYINTLTDLSDCVLTGDNFLPESGLSIKLEGITNDGTYRARKYVAGNQLELNLPVSYPDPNNGAISWTVHDGYRLSLTHSRLVRDSVELFAALGNEYVGGVRRPTEGTDFEVNYEDGSLLQIGYHAGTWGLGSPGSADVYVNYSWLMEVFAEVTAGSGVLSSSDDTLFVNETAMWAPDAKVDKFNLYNNYGYLINRFDASSETYREFIRGVFQLYILGPTLERLESALNVIAGFPVIRDDGEVLLDFDNTTDPDYNIVTTQRPDGTTAIYRYPNTLLLRSDIQNPANYNTLAFESFEPLTLAFKVSDYVEDPAWWTDIIIPRELMPTESLARRRIIGALIENVIGAWDGPRIGDPGFFIGADDEGIVPSFIGTYPAKRRKMANVVMNTFLKWNIFFARFDETAIAVLSPSFVNDLIELVLVAKPGYRFMFIEPLNNFEDVMLIQEDDLEINGMIPVEDAMALGEDALTIQSLSWQIGDQWAPVPPVTGQALVVADGATIPNGGTAIDLGADNIISKMVFGPSEVQEDIDYDIDYAAGELTPKTVWPAGAYTIDFRNIEINPTAASWTARFTSLPTQTDLPVATDQWGFDVNGSPSPGEMSFDSTVLTSREWINGTPSAPAAYETLASMGTDATKILRVTSRGQLGTIALDLLSPSGSGGGVALFGPGRDDASLDYDWNNNDGFSPVIEGRAYAIENGTKSATQSQGIGVVTWRQCRIYWNPTGSAFTITDTGFGSHSVPANNQSWWFSDDDGVTWVHLADRAIDAGVVPDRVGVFAIRDAIDDPSQEFSYVWSNLEVMEWTTGAADTMPFSLGCPDPKKVRSRQELFRNGMVLGATLPYRLYDPDAGFEAALHTDKFIKIHNGGIEGLHQILRVINSTTAVLRPDRLHPVIGGLSDVTGLTWGFVSEEPYDGQIYHAGGEVRFVSATAYFPSNAKDRFIHVYDATNPENNKRHRITRVLSMARVVIEGTTLLGPDDPVPEANLHWRLEGTELHMDLVERPLFIKVT